MSVTPATAPTAALRNITRRSLALVVVCGALGLLGIGALADTLAVAPLHPPTRAIMTNQAGLDNISLTISPGPLTAGRNTAFTLRIQDSAGAPVAQAHVVCDFTMPAMPMPAMRPIAVEQSPGVYMCQETLPDAGMWAVTISFTAPANVSAHTTFALQSR
ncbi:MAG TPA: FixH family protein [Ktedonobacterales bacterium]